MIENKPTIYNAPSIYKIGGSGGGGGEIQQEFRYFEILGKEYKYVKIDDDLWWPCENLDYKDENISEGLNDYLNVLCCAYYDNDEENYKYNGLFYSLAAITYITTLVPAYCRRIASGDVSKILSYIQNKLALDWIVPDLLKTYCAKTNKKNNNLWTNSLALLEMGFEPTGYVYGSKHDFGGILSDAYFGVTGDTVNTTLANVINFRNATTIGFAGGGQSNNAYVLRFMIEE